MAFDAGAITGTIGLDTSSLKRSLGDVRRMMGGLKESTNRTFAGLGTSIAGNLIGGLASSGISSAIRGVFSGVKWGAELAMQAEQSKIAFEVMLGSAKQAKAMLANLNQFATDTPFGVQGLTQASKTLLNFGVNVKEVMPDLSMLSNVAAGNEQKLQSLALVYGQVSANGHLMGQDLLQMVNVGFNPLNNIVKRTGESMAQVRKRMAEGAIGIKEVRQAFVDATSKGGLFYHMNEKESKSLLGMFSTLHDEFGNVAKAIMQSVFTGIDLKGLVGQLNVALPAIKQITLAGTYFAVDVLGALVHNLAGVGQAGKNSGNAVLASFEAVGKTVAYVMDLGDALRFGFNKLRITGMEFISEIAKGLHRVQEAVAHLPKWMAGDAQQRANESLLFAKNIDDEIAKIQSGMTKRLAGYSHVDQVSRYFVNVREQIKKTADQVGKTPIVGVKAAISVQGTANVAAIKKAMQAGDLLGGLKANLHDIGLDAIQKKMSDIRKKGILDPDQLKEARKLLTQIDMKTKVHEALASIKSPVDDLTARIKQLKDWLAKGLINPAQFQQLRAKANKNLFGGDRLASLNRVGSARERALQYDQARGARANQQLPVAKQQLNELKEIKQEFSQMTSLWRRWMAEERSVDIPGLF